MVLDGAMLEEVLDTTLPALGRCGGTEGEWEETNWSAVSTMICRMRCCLCDDDVVALAWLGRGKHY